MQESVCELAGVSKSYGGRPVLRDVSLTIAAGEMVAVTGRSGSGKSTLLNVVGLLEKADSGEVRLFGEWAKVGSRGATRLLRDRLGYLFQNFALIDGDTVDNNLKIAQAYGGGSRTALEGNRAQALQAVGLPGVGSRKVYELSGGEQQRVAIARLMLKPCDLVLADEPTGSLDAANASLVIELLRELNRRGKSVLVVTHDGGVAAACHRTIDLPDAAGGMTWGSSTPGRRTTPQRSATSRAIARMT